MLLLHRGVFEGPVIEIFAPSLYDSASQQGKPVVARQMIHSSSSLHFSFLTSFCFLVSLVKVITASCCLNPVWWHLPA